MLKIENVQIIKLIAVAALVVGCDGGSPVAPDGAPLGFSPNVCTQGSVPVLRLEEVATEIKNTIGVTVSFTYNQPATTCNFTVKPGAANTEWQSKTIVVSETAIDEWSESATTFKMMTLIGIAHNTDIGTIEEIKAGFNPDLGAVIAGTSEFFTENDAYFLEEIAKKYENAPIGG